MLHTYCVTVVKQTSFEICWKVGNALVSLLVADAPSATTSIVEIPDSNVHWAYMGPIWVLSAPDGPHVGPMNCAIWDFLSRIVPPDQNIALFGISVASQITGNPIFYPTTDIQIMGNVDSLYVIVDFKTAVVNRYSANDIMNIHMDIFSLFMSYILLLKHNHVFTFYVIPPHCPARECLRCNIHDIVKQNYTGKHKTIPAFRSEWFYIAIAMRWDKNLYIHESR